MKRFFSAIKHILKAYREDYLPGVIVFFILFLIGNLLNASISYMGNSGNDLIMTVLKSFLPLIILHVLKIILAYILIGAVLSVFFQMRTKRAFAMDRHLKKKSYP